MDPELHTLTGAYALDALDDAERAAFEEHLAECEACQQEVREFEQTAATLGSALAEDPPASMKAAVMSEIATTRQERPRQKVVDLPVASPEVPALGRAWLDRVVLPAAAVLAVLVVGLSLVVGNLNRRIDNLEASTLRVTDVVAAPDLQSWDATVDGVTARVVFSPTRGQGLFVADGLAAAPDGMVYELWLIGADGDPVAAGIFDATDGNAVHPMTGDMAEVVAVAVTVEPDGGSAQPTTDPFVVVQL